MAFLNNIPMLYTERCEGHLHLCILTSATLEAFNLCIWRINKD